MLFDCHGTASAAYFNHHAQGLELNKDTVIQRYITARLEVDFKKPTPMDEEIIIRSSLAELGERKAIIEMTLEAKGEVRSKAKMVAVKIKDQ